MGVQRKKPPETRRERTVTLLVLGLEEELLEPSRLSQGAEQRRETSNNEALSWELERSGSKTGKVSFLRAERTDRGLGFLWVTWPHQNDSGPQGNTGFKQG